MGCDQGIQTSQRSYHSQQTVAKTRVAGGGATGEGCCIINQCLRPKEAVLPEGRGPRLV